MTETKDRFTLKDSGERQGFDTGAVRDTASGKGRYDLMPVHSRKRVSIIFEKGAIKYKARNWEKGIPLARFLDSASRHLDQYIEGNYDEDHLAQAAWNILCAIETEERINRGILPVTLVTDEANDGKYSLPSYVPDAPEETIVQRARKKLGGILKGKSD